MKRIRCYGRKKTNKVESSKNQAVFDSNTLNSLGMDSKKENKFPEPDISQAELFTSFYPGPLNVFLEKSSSFSQSVTKGCKRRKLMRKPAKRVSIYLRRKRCANVSNRSSISLLNKSSAEKPVSKKASNIINNSRTSKFPRQCKKGTGVARTKSKLQNKNRTKKLKGRKLPHKKRNHPSLNEACDMPPIPNEPHWPSILEHSLNIENQNERRFNDFRNINIKPCYVKLLRLPLNLECGPGALVSKDIPCVPVENDRFQASTTPKIKPCCVRLPRLPSNLESATGTLIPMDIPRVQEENDESQSSTPPKIKDCYVRLPRLPPNLESGTGTLAPNDIPHVQEENDESRSSTPPKIKDCYVRLPRLPPNLKSGTGTLAPNDIPHVQEENDESQSSTPLKIKDCCVRLTRLPPNFNSGTGTLAPNDIPHVQEENDELKSSTPPSIKDCCAMLSRLNLNLESETGTSVSKDIPCEHEEHDGFKLPAAISDPQNSPKTLPVQRMFHGIGSRTSNIATSTPLTSTKKTPFNKAPEFNLSGIYKSNEAHGLDTNALLTSTNKVASSVGLSDVKSGISELNPEQKVKSPETFLEVAQNLGNAMDVDVNPLLSPSAAVSNRSLSHSNKLQTSAVFISPNRTCDVHSVSKKVSLKGNSFCPDVECNLSKLLEHCGQDSVVEFNDVFDWSLISVKKIGEGTYGEVFMITKKKSSSVIKVIPFFENEDRLISERNLFFSSMQTIESVYSEMKVAHCLSELRTDVHNQTKNFNKLKSSKIVKGLYPSQMLNAWDSFSNTRSTYNDRPDVFDEHQKFVILELEFGGKDMSEFAMRNAAEAQCIFKQLAISLAIAEEAYLFEHRDMHLGNILVQRTNTKKLSYILRGKEFTIPSEGVVVTIIDFTLSRVLKSGCVYFNDLANEESLFNQSGDFQFEVYKQTREFLKNEWQTSVLYSNVLWLSFFCVKALSYKYSRPTSKKHLECFMNIQMIQKKLPKCNSALDVFRLLNIVENIPMRSHAQSARLSRATKFLDRKSLQKPNMGI